MSFRNDIFGIEIGGIWDGNNTTPRRPAVFTTAYDPEMVSDFPRSFATGTLTSIPTQVSAKWDVGKAVPSDITVEFDITATPEVRRRLLSSTLLASSPDTARADKVSIRLVRPIHMKDTTIVFAYQYDENDTSVYPNFPTSFPQYFFIGTECFRRVTSPISAPPPVSGITPGNSPWKTHYRLNVERAALGTIKQRHDIESIVETSTTSPGDDLHLISTPIIRANTPSSIVGLPVRVSSYSREDKFSRIRFNGFISEVIDSGDLIRIIVSSSVKNLERAFVPKFDALPPYGLDMNNGLPASSGGFDYNGLEQVYPYVDGLGGFISEDGQGAPNTRRSGIRNYGMKGNPSNNPSNTNCITTPVLPKQDRVFISTGAISYVVDSIEETTANIKQRRVNLSTPYGLLVTTVGPNRNYPLNYRFPYQVRADEPWGEWGNWRAIVWEGDGEANPHVQVINEDTGQYVGNPGPPPDVYTIVGVEPGLNIKDLATGLVSGEEYLWQSLGEQQYKVVPASIPPIYGVVNPNTRTDAKRFSWKLPLGTFYGTDWDYLSHTKMGGRNRDPGVTRKLPQSYVPGRVYRCPTIFPKLKEDIPWTAPQPLPSLMTPTESGIARNSIEDFDDTTTETQLRGLVDEDIPSHYTYDIGTVSLNHNFFFNPSLVLNDLDFDFESNPLNLQRYSHELVLYREPGDTDFFDTLDPWPGGTNNLQVRTCYAWRPEFWKDRSLADILIKDFYQLFGVTYSVRSDGQIVPARTLGKPDIDNFSVVQRTIDITNIRNSDFTISFNDEDNINTIELKGFNAYVSEVVEPDPDRQNINFLNNFKVARREDTIVLRAVNEYGSLTSGKKLTIDLSKNPYIQSQANINLLRPGNGDVALDAYLIFNNVLDLKTDLINNCQDAWARFLQIFAKPDPTVILVVDDDFIGQPGEWCRVNVPGIPKADGYLTTEKDNDPVLGFILERGDKWEEGTSELKIRLVGWSDTRVNYLEP